MATTPISPRSLPPNPNEEYLRKQAKRHARGAAMQLATAQRQLAQEYGYRNWAELMTAVQAKASLGGTSSGADGSPPASPPACERAPNVVPLLPLRGLVAFPHVSYPIFVGRPMSIKAVVHAEEQNIPILLAAQRDARVTNLTDSDMYEVGTIAQVVETLRLPDGNIKIVVEGKRRAHLSRLILNEDSYQAEAEAIEEAAGISDPQLESITRSALSAFLRERVRTVSENKPEAFGISATTADGASVLADRMASELQMELAMKQALLQILNPLERLEKLLAYLNALS